MGKVGGMKPLRYQNPVWEEYFADPFVLRVGDEYWAYGTSPRDESGRQFAVLRSEDLVNWEYRGHALEPIAEAVPTSYWAPEVAERDGTFYLYYSASTSQSDADQRLRVATSKDPAGPFVDSGKLLLSEDEFSIDAHPFRDPRTGRWYLFFAADFVHDEPHGTGLMAAELGEDMMSIIGTPRMVVRASCPWHVYEYDRDYKGRVWKAWHCIEGPFVLFREGRYYCLYSGGAWHSENYGLGYAVADSPLGPYHDEMAQHGPTVLQGVPGRVVGPGHNSVVLGPDDRTLFAVYHAWDPGHTARRMCIDPLTWTEQGPKVDGPSFGVREIG